MGYMLAELPGSRLELGIRRLDGLLEVEMRVVSRTQMWRASTIMPDVLLGAGLIGLDVVARLVPHAFGFTPLVASALFAAAMFRLRALSFAVPLIAMVLSDSVLGFDDWRVMSVVYAATALPAAMVLWAGRLRSPLVLLSIAASASVFFFISTNFAVWAFGTLYTRDFAGLATCYVAALPFFQNQLAGDLFWTCVLFGGHRLVLLPAWRMILPRRRAAS